MLDFVDVIVVVAAAQDFRVDVCGKEQAVAFQSYDTGSLL